jgi:hypothetical protein
MNMNLSFYRANILFTAQLLSINGVQTPPTLVRYALYAYRKTLRLYRKCIHHVRKRKFAYRLLKNENKLLNKDNVIIRVLKYMKIIKDEDMDIISDDGDSDSNEVCIYLYM